MFTREAELCCAALDCLVGATIRLQIADGRLQVACFLRLRCYRYLQVGQVQHARQRLPVNRSLKALTAAAGYLILSDLPARDEIEPALTPPSKSPIATGTALTSILHQH